MTAERTRQGRSDRCALVMAQRSEGDMSQENSAAPLCKERSSESPNTSNMKEEEEEEELYVL